MRSWIRDHLIAAAAIGTLLAIAATTAMDAVGQSNFNTLPLVPLFVLFWLCWLLVASVGQKRPMRPPHPLPFFLPIAQRKSTISSIDSLIFTEGEWTSCSGFSPSSRG